MHLRMVAIATMRSPTMPRANRTTIKTTVYLPAIQLRALAAISKHTGAPVAELIRRAIAAYITSAK